MPKCRSGVVWWLCAVAPMTATASCQTSGGASPNPGGSSNADAAATPASQSFALNITAVDTTFVTRDHFIAAVEMQLSGEPFAESMGRDLSGYSRDFSCQASVCDPSLYHDPALNEGVAGGPNFRDDLAGFSSAVESYEYSKQPMNNIAFESGAGTALAFGPVLDSNGATGTDAQQALRDWVQHMGAAATPRAASCTPTSRRTTPSGGPGSGRRCSPSRRGTRRFKRAMRRPGARSARTTTPGRAARSTATTTSATTPRSTCRTVRRR